MTSTPPAQLKRYDGLDAVRATAMLLGVCYHAAYAYVPDIGRWYFMADIASSSHFVTVVGALHSFRMQVFFTLSGFFAHLVLERRGPHGFLVDRARRLVLPFLVALPLTLLADVGLRRLSQAEGLMSPDYAEGIGWRLTPLHLWFLEYLFAFCLVAWGLARAGLTGQWVAKGLAAVLRVPEALVLVGVPLGMAMEHLGELKPAASFVPQAHAFFHYGLFFALGWLVWPARDAVGTVTRRGWWLAPVGLGLAYYVFSRHLQWEPRGQFLAGIIPVVMTVGSLGLAFRVPTATRPTLRFLVEASYWVYLVHYPLVLTLQVLLARLGWPAGLKYLVVVALTFGLAFASFRLFVARSALGPWLGVKPRPVA